MGFKENLKSELTYSGMLVKELAAKSGVSKYSLDNYLNARGQVPSVEAAVKIAHTLGVSVEYLVTGKEGQTPQLSSKALTIGRLAERLRDEDQQFVIDFIKWLETRH